jgi:hypothetical protein
VVGINRPGGAAKVLDVHKQELGAGRYQAGCVLRPFTVVSQLCRREQQLITNYEVEWCKNYLNTWAFIGDEVDKPQKNCVFKSDDAQNEFLSNPKVGLGQDEYDDNIATVPSAKATADNTAVRFNRVMSTPGPSN